MQFFLLRESPKAPGLLDLMLDPAAKETPPGWYQWPQHRVIIPGRILHTEPEHGAFTERQKGKREARGPEKSLQKSRTSSL